MAGEGAAERQKLVDAGFNAAELETWQRDEGRKLQGAGFTQREIDDYWNVPAPKATGLTAALQDNVAANAPVIADNPFEAFAAGLNMSASDIARRVTTGDRSPGTVLPEDAGIGNKLLMTAGRVVGDLPATVAGFIGGSVAAAPVAPLAGPAAPGVLLAGGGFGSAALPAAIRETYMDSVTNGKVTSFGDLMERATDVAVTVGKEGVIGGVTAPIGGAVGGRVLAATASKGGALAADGITQALAGTAMQGAFQGEVPDADDFMVAAGMALGFHAAGTVVGATRRFVPNRRSEKVAGNLRAIYAKTGRAPWEIVEAAKTDPALRQEMLAEDINGGPVTAMSARNALREPEPYKAPAAPKDGAPSPGMIVRTPDGLGQLIAFTEGSATFGKRNNIPEAQVVSSADAVGRFQVTPGTAHQYMGGAFFGVGEAYNPAQKGAIMAKLKDPKVNEEVANVILADLAKRYKLPDGAVDIEAVLVAYNAGPGRANQFIRNGRNYEKLPLETQRYLQRAEGFKGQIDRGVEPPEPVKAPQPECG